MYFRTSLDEWSAQRSYLHHTINSSHKRQTSVPPARSEPAVLANERTKSHTVDQAANGIGPFMLKKFMKELCQWVKFFSLICLTEDVNSDLFAIRAQLNLYYVTHTCVSRRTTTGYSSDW